MAVGLPLKTTYANGDVYSSSDVNDTNGTVNLFTSSTLSIAAAKNCIINGGSDIWQRGTTFTSFGSLQYAADRWSASTAGTTINLTVTQQTSVPNTRSQYSQRYMQVTTGATSLTEYCARQFIEQANVLQLHGKTAVLSFWYRSNKAGTHGARIYAGYNTGGGDNVVPFTVSVADTWEFKTIAVSAFSTVTANSAAFNAAGAIVDLGFRVGGTGAGFTSVSASDYFQFTQVQLELGSTATSFSRAGGTIQGELAACQRYYFRSTVTTNYGYLTPLGTATSTTNVLVRLGTPVIMRSGVGTVDYSSNIQVSADDSNIAAITAITLQAGANFNNVMLNLTTSGLTQFRPYYAAANNSTSSFIGISVEL